MASKIDSLIADFVVALRQAIAEEAAQAFVVAGGGQPDLLQRRKPGPKPKAAGLVKAPKRGKGQKRSPEALEALKKAIVAAVRKEPGQRSEQLALVLDTTTADLALPVKALVAAGALKTKGQRRGTSYHPGKA